MSVDVLGTDVEPWLAVEFVVGISIALLGILLLFLSRRRFASDARWRSKHVALLIAGSLLGGALSWVPWPVAHQLAAQPGVAASYWGMPVPVGVRLHYEGRRYFGSNLGLIAIFLNAGFGAGAAQAPLFLRARRRSSRTRTRRGAHA